MPQFQAILHASELLTGEGIREKDGRRVQEDDLSAIPDGALVHDGKKVHWVGLTADLPKKYLRAKRRDLKGRHALIPGLVDCHNHLVFAGNRADEFAARCGGATYQEIAEKGGGIRTTVRATRAASSEELLQLAESRLAELASFGVRTLEIKSGYGLDHATELKILRVAQILKKKYPEFLIQVTYLGAHAFPEDRPREVYLQEMTDLTLPAVAKARLADACDVFIDQGYYTLAEGERLLAAASKLGLRVKVHADELVCTESASLAVKVGALSADHLLQVSDQGVQDLARSQTVAVLLPGTAFYLKASHAPARKLIDQGACVAIATDFNPGTCMTLSLPSVMTIAALYLGMSRSEIFSSVTYAGAKALGLEKRRGTLLPGMDAAFFEVPFQKFEELYYRFAWSPLPLSKASPRARTGSQRKKMM